jgi:hypothetical protein
MNKKLICALVMAAAAAPAFADFRGQNDGIDERQSRLEQRIEQGRRSGELTRNEYGRLRNELRLIARDEHAYRADGYLSQREWQYLNTRLDAVSREVAYERRDAERRGPSHGGPSYNDYRTDRRF